MITTQAHADLTAVPQRQQATWTAGDDAVIGTTLILTGERLCTAIEVRPGQVTQEAGA